MQGVSEVLALAHALPSVGDRVPSKPLKAFRGVGGAPPGFVSVGAKKLKPTMVRNNIVRFIVDISSPEFQPPTDSPSGFRAPLPGHSPA